MRKGLLELVAKGSSWWGQEPPELQNPREHIWEGAAIEPWMPMTLTSLGWMTTTSIGWSLKVLPCYESYQGNRVCSEKPKLIQMPFLLRTKHFKEKKEKKDLPEVSGCFNEALALKGSSVKRRHNVNPWLKLEVKRCLLEMKQKFRQWG